MLPVTSPGDRRPKEVAMIYELRTYTLKPGRANEFEQRWAPMVEGRQKLSPLGALWRSDIGPLNRFFHVWPYASLAERDRIRAEAAKDPHWPPATGQYLVAMENKILVPAAFSPLR